MALLLILVTLLFGVGFGNASTGSWHAAPSQASPQPVIPYLHSGTGKKDPDPCVRGSTGKKRSLPRGCAPRLAPPLP
jgi:hypothetical protein